MPLLELFASRACPFCAEAREQLEWDGRAYVEHDVDADPAARARLHELVGAAALVPVLVEDGRVTQVGWRGRGCHVGTA
jgi:mycoredoxin